MKVLVFNQLKFLPHGTVVQPGYHGTYSAKSSLGIHLYKPCGELCAYIVNNPKQGRFVVEATMTEEGPRYMFSTCEPTEKWLNIKQAGLMREDELISQISYEVLVAEQPALATA